MLLNDPITPSWHLEALWPMVVPDPRGCQIATVFPLGPRGQLFALRVIKANYLGALVVIEKTN